MKILALSLAAVSALAPLASAQTDAAFAAALPPPSFAALAQYKAAGAQKPAAAPKTIVADPAAWKKALEAVKIEGAYTPEAGLMPGSFAIDDSTGDPKGDHTEEKISVLGALNDDDKFEPMGVMLVHKEFKLDPKDGKWRIDQWMYSTDVYGEVDEVGHSTLIKSLDGKSTVLTPDKLKAEDPRIKAQFDAMIKHWAERKPKGS